MLSKVHLPIPVEHPKHPGTVTAVPLLCGRRWEHDTRVSYAIEKVTCGQCKNLHRRFQEDLEHKRTMAKLEAQREIEQPHP